MENVIIVGSMANNFIKYNGYNIGKSIFEKNQENLSKEIIENSIIKSIAPMKDDTSTCRHNTQ